MALTPEDVVNKIFTAKTLRRGYDENEVDDFLDEIVAELRRQGAENADLRTQLEECQKGRGITPAASTGAAVVGTSPGDTSTRASVKAAAGHGVAGESGASDEAADATTAAEQAEQAEQESRERIAAGQGAEASGSTSGAEDGSTSAAELAGAGALGAGGAAGVIALAQKLHDEHVSEGQATRERLISEGQEQHDRFVGDGQSQHDELVSTAQARHDELITEATQRSETMVSEAEEHKRSVLDALGREKDVLTEKIEQLRTFERDYRARLKSYIEGQLEELDHTAVDVEAPDPRADEAPDAPAAEDAEAVDRTGPEQPEQSGHTRDQEPGDHS